MQWKSFYTQKFDYFVIFYQLKKQLIMSLTESIFRAILIKIDYFSSKNNNDSLDVALWKKHVISAHVVDLLFLSWESAIYQTNPYIKSEYVY